MAERAGLFEEDFDVTAFVPKKGVSVPQPPSEEVRAVSEAAKFQSREPVQAPSTKPSKKKQTRRRRTGRNMQLNLKVAAEPFELFYQITDLQGWVLGETFEKAVAALQRELAAQK
jgi:hypothetical protein